MNYLLQMKVTRTIYQQLRLAKDSDLFYICDIYFYFQKYLCYIIEN